MSKLKKCPFCGGEAAYTQILGNYGRPHEVYCFTCDGGITEGRSKDGVIHNWNNRPIEDELRARIAELEAAQRWIPVSERLPQIGVRVLFYNNFITNIHKGWFSGDEWTSDIGIFYNGDKLKRITHWMPLPEPPEVQE